MTNYSNHSNEYVQSQACRKFYPRFEPYSSHGREWVVTWVNKKSSFDQSELEKQLILVHQPGFMLIRGRCTVKFWEVNTKPKLISRIDKSFSLDSLNGNDPFCASEEKRENMTFCLVVGYQFLVYLHSTVMFPDSWLGQLATSASYVQMVIWQTSPVIPCLAR